MRDADEIDLDDWYELDLEPASAPKNWSDPLADVEEVEDDEELDEDADEKPARRAGGP